MLSAPCRRRVTYPCRRYRLVCYKKLQYIHPAETRVA